MNITKKTLISVAAVAALGSAGLATPQLVSAASSDQPSNVSGFGHDKAEPGDDHGHHAEPGEDHGHHPEPG
ncbi:MAG: hypothetical protein ABJA81_12900, partial [Nocardioidaceae bacterium]